MPRAKILSTQAMHTLHQLHAELAGKVLDNKAEAKRLTTAMLQVEAVMKLLQPGYDVRPIAVRRRKPNPWFKRGMVFRCAREVLRDAMGPMLTREIAETMLARKGITNAPQRAVRDLAGGVQFSLRNHDGKSVETVGEGMPVRWFLKI
jgi:hypothetical protein